jgi:exonuclease SbcC
MQITRLELRNIKSYADTVIIEFAHGVNAISGPNGAGKSTLLEAIGFALFDSLPYKQDDFLRQGEKHGEVAVHFVDALDEREYVLTRPLGGGTLSITDAETERKLEEGKQDVVDWLKKHMGVEASADLTALFEDAIGVPQGLLTATFLENDATRKKKFDPLLQVDDYEAVWRKLLDSQRHLNEERQAQEQRIAGLQGELKRLPDLKQEIEQLEVETGKTEKDLKAAAKHLEEAAVMLASLDVDRKAIDDTAGRIRTLEARLGELTKQHADAAEAVKEAENARQVQEKTKSAFDTYESAQQELKALEAKRVERDALRQSLSELEKELARLQTEIESRESALGEIEAAETELARIQRAADRQAELEDELPQAREANTRLKLISEQLEKERTVFIALDARRGEIEAGVQRRTELEEELQGVAESLRDLEAEYAGLETECAGVEHQRDQIAERLGLLETTDEAICPVCRQTLDAAHRQELEQHYADEQTALDQTETRSRKRMVEIEKEITRLQKKHQTLQDELTSLPLPKQKAEIKSEIGRAQTQLEKQESQVDDLRQAPEHLAALEAELAELGDPRSQAKALGIKINARPKLESDHKQTRKKLDENEKQAAQIQSQMVNFADLDQRLTDAAAQRDENTAGHRRYLEHAAVADSYEARAAKSKTLDNEIQECENEKKQLTSEYEKLEAGYDRGEHDRLKDEHDALARDHTSLETRLSLGQERLADLQDEIAALQVKETELQSTEQARQRLEELSEMLDFVRRTVRQAGPYVTRALVQVISLEAGRIYAEIMGDHTQRLRWNEDYSISIEQGGQERAFSQLSGGEKMAAALAVRLALLQEMSQIRLAFFDEPTANLDDERRENLAEQITQITGFDQLFVISHDDTFERETHHVIRVSKDGGVSKVEVG